HKLALFRHRFQLIGVVSYNLGKTTPNLNHLKISVRTLADSKVEGDHYRGSASLELYRGSLLQIAAQMLQKILFY
ncbi:hypothetical protein B296_00043071, partial [Ensete ventricosum]